MTDSTSPSYPNIAQSFAICGIVILGFILSSPVNFLMDEIIGKEGAGLLYYLAAMGVSFYAMSSIRKRKTGSSTFRLTINPEIIPFLILGTIGLLFGIITPAGSAIPMPDSVKKIFMELSKQTGPFAFLTMVVAAPILEELIFRGIMLDGLLYKYPPIKSILVSALLFGLVHLNPWQFVTGFIIGIFSGWVYYHTRSLIACIIIHASANLTGFFMRFIIQDVEAIMNNEPFKVYGGFANFMLITCTCIGVTAFCFWFLKKQFLKHKKGNWRLAKIVDES